VKSWDIYTADVFGEHPCVLISCQGRIDFKPEVVVLGCRTMQPGNEREARANETILDDADGLELKTLCRCDLLFTVPTALLCYSQKTIPKIAANALPGGQNLLNSLRVKGIFGRQLDRWWIAWIACDR
jgi:hypothetical protein